MKTVEVKKIALSVRSWVENHYTPDDFYIDLCGACALASFTLTRALQLQGEEADFVEGYYSGECHCWVVWKGRIVDITATQFDESLPKIYIAKNDISYEQDHYGVEAIKYVKKYWHKSGLLKKYDKKIGKFLKKLGKKEEK